MCHILTVELSDYPVTPHKVSEEKTLLLHRYKKPEKSRIFLQLIQTKVGRRLPMPYLDISILVSRDKESNVIRLLHYLCSN